MTAQLRDTFDLESPAALPHLPGTRGYRLPVEAEENLAGQLTDYVKSELAEQAVKAGAKLPTDRRETLTEELLDAELASYSAAAARQDEPGLSPAATARIRARVRADVLGFGPLQVLLDDPDVETINAQGCDEVFTTLADGTYRRELPLAPDDEVFTELIRSLANSGGQERRFDRASAMLSAQLEDGSRLFAMLGITERPVFSIRRDRLKDITLDQLVAGGLCNEEVADFLRALVRARMNLLISGGTAAGKTTLLRALASEMPPRDRLVVIEDTYELRLDRLKHRHHQVVACQAREANTEGSGRVTQAELLRAALRLSPDRVIVGEVRGEELVPMCNAMSLGHDGSMATIHASSSGHVKQRLVNIGYQCPERLSAEATVAMVASAVNFIVHLDTDAVGRRVVASIREVCGAEDAMLRTGEVYKPDADGHAVYAVCPEQRHLRRLAAAGFDVASSRRAAAW